MNLPIATQKSTAPLRRQFFQLAIVNVLSNLMVPLAGLLDVAFLGHLAEIHHLAGVAIATVLFNCIYWTLAFLRMGTTGMTAQAFGRGDEDAGMLIALRNGAIALGLGMLILLLQQPIAAIGFTLLSATPEVKLSGQLYFNAMIWGAPATLLNLVLVGWFLGRGQSQKVLWLSLVNNSAKVLFDYLLIVRWGWEASGAGTATVISQYLMALLGLLLLQREIPWEKVRQLGKELFDPNALRAIFVLNREILIRTFSILMAFAAFTNLSSSMGTLVLATNTVLLQVVSFSAYFVDGLAFATESVAGMLRGRNAIAPKGELSRTAELRYLLRISGIASLAVGLTIASLFVLQPAPLFRLLTNHTDVLQRLTIYSPWLLPVLGFGAIAYMLDGYFLGLTEGRILRQSAITAALVGFAPVAIVAWYAQSSHLLWLAMTLLMAMRVVTLVSRIPGTLRQESAPPAESLSSKVSPDAT